MNLSTRRPLISQSGSEGVRAVQCDGSSSGDPRPASHDIQRHPGAFASPFSTAETLVRSEVCLWKMSPVSQTSVWGAVLLWGEQVSPTTLLLNGKSFGVTQNLEEPLQYLILPTADRVLRIEALFINQSDMAERILQLRHMYQIYTMADRVVAGLAHSGLIVTKPWSW